MTRALSLAALAAPFCVFAACGGTSAEPPLFQPNPECMGASVVAYSGSDDSIISSLAIGSTTDGFDLDGDGKPDNKLAAVGSLASTSIQDSFKNYSVLIPMEFFDLTTVAPDTCVKFAVYLGTDPYKVDNDGDGKEATVPGGDCNDNDPNIYPGAPEIAGNGKDDDCDGKADDVGGVPSTDTTDADHDGVTIAQGDCDDTDPMVHPGLPEICGDGKDNDCDGVADRTNNADGTSSACNPFDDTPDPVKLDPRSFGPDGKPLIAFLDGTITSTPDGLLLHAGPSLFEVTIPVTGGLNLDLKLTGATIEGIVTADGNGIEITKGRIGGIIDARTADNIRGLNVTQIGLTPDDSLLDAVFANLLGPLLALPHSTNKMFPDCRSPDIDVDRDGRETFCDSNPNDNIKTVDTCVDGDGTVVMDSMDAAGNVIQCTDAKDAKGNYRFVDGISVELNFETRPTIIMQ
jgi:hypothetical protein